LSAEVIMDPLFSDHMVIQQGVTIPVWGKAAPGEKVRVACAGREASTVADASGRWRVILRPTLFTGERCEMIVHGSNRIEIHDVLPGDVWIAAGEGGMRSPLSDSGIGMQAAATPDPGTRFFVRDTTGKESWVVVSTKTSPSLPAVPFFFARDLRAAKKTPVGILDCTTALSAPIDAWIGSRGLQGLAPLDHAPTTFGSTHSRLFRNLIEPLVPFAITGVIWCQGSSDEGRNALRHRLFLAHLIRDWRHAWEQGPFAFVMLLPPGESHGKGSPDNFAVEPFFGERGKPRRALPWITEGMVSALSLPDTGLVSAIDLAGDDGDFDPLVAGRRLALMARHLVYGEDVACTGPVFRRFQIEGRKVRLLFEGAQGGLTIGSAPGSSGASDGFVTPSLRGFAIRGKEGRWFPAEAKIDGDCVLLASDAVPKPVAARYNWKSAPEGNLYDRAGLPARPFRTDSDQPR
jgi:sialate O-acetylesterase